MQPPPWHADRPLDAAIVRKLLASQFPAQFPDLAADDVRYLHSGWDSDAYVATDMVGDAWIFRFPRRREVEGWLAREQALLPRLGPRLPLPIPQPCFAGKPGGHFPYHFMGYRKIDGTPAHVLVPDDRFDADHARRLGAFLSALHAFPADDARACGLQDATGDNAGAMRAEAHRLRDRHLPGLPPALRDRCAAFLDNATIPSRYTGPLRVCHADLEAEHILVAADGTLAGVIDFGDVVIGDPAGDFAGLHAWRGADFLRAALDHYTLPIDPGFADRAAFLGRCLSLVNFAHADATDPERVARESRFVATAFGA